MIKKKKFWIITSIILFILVTSSLLFLFLHIIPENQKKLELENAIAQYRQAKLDKYTEENNQYDDYEVDIAFLGDSLTDGYNLEKFYPKYTTANRGIGGDTTFDLEKRLQVSAYDLKPKIAVLLIGANNFKTMFDNYEDIIIGLKDNLPNTQLVLLSLTAMSGNWGKNNEIACFNNVKIKILAEKYNCTYIDLFTPLFDHATNGIYPEYTTDGGHLTDQGYEVMTSIITPVIENIS